MKILVIEVEVHLAEAIVEYLKHEGHICELAGTYQTAEQKIIVYSYDCVIVDITLPGGSGLSLINILKKHSETTGVIIISAKNSLDDKISGLDIGADDYLTKPFHLSELNARLRSLNRRKSFKGSKEIQFQEINIVPESGVAYINQKAIELTKKEYDLLLFFITNKNRVLTKEAIAEHLWGDHVDASDSFDFIYTHIKNLRKKLIEYGCKDYIKTAYGMGYKFTI